MANTAPVISDTAASQAVQARVREIGLIEAFQAVSLTRNFDGKDTMALNDLDSSVVPIATEDGKEVESSSVMLEAMKSCAKRGVIVSCHCEDPDLAHSAQRFRKSALESQNAEEVFENLAKAEKICVSPKIS